MKIAEKYLTDAVSAKRAQMIATKAKDGDIDFVSRRLPGEIYGGLEMIDKWMRDPANLNKAKKQIGILMKKLRPYAK